MGGVVVVDLNKKQDPDYVQEVYNILNKDLAFFVTLRKEGTQAKYLNIDTVTVEGDLVTLVHKYTSGNTLVNHTHYFYKDGTYDQKSRIYKFVE